MSPTEQENRCIQHACEFLSSTIGGRWVIERALDDLNPSEPTPEVVVTNGQTTAAIEVKRMLGDSNQLAYHASLRSNERYLIPSCGGYYSLAPPVDVRLPINTTLRRQLKGEIERVAPTLQPEEPGVLLIPRTGFLSLVCELNPPMIFCLHNSSYELFQPIHERLRGRFMLVDEGFEHSFFTTQGKDAFREAVVAACDRRLNGDSSPFAWNEEWQITRLRDAGDGDDDDRDGVWIFACSGARSVPESINENLQAILDNALHKFVRRWAPLHVLVLEENIESHTRFIHDTIAALGSTELPNIEYVLLVANDDVLQCHP